VGIAVGSGTDVAAKLDIILVNSNPKDILNLILFGKATYKKMVQNLIWATGYNAVAIPLAAGVLYSTGFVLDPAIGAVFMSLRLLRAINAQLLKRQITPKKKLLNEYTSRTYDSFARIMACKDVESIT
jgi:Cu2+-exporting ATPase